MEDRNLSCVVQTLAAKGPQSATRGPLVLQAFNNPEAGAASAASNAAGGQQTLANALGHPFTEILRSDSWQVFWAVHSSGRFPSRCSYCSHSWQTSWQRQNSVRSLTASVTRGISAQIRTHAPATGCYKPNTL